MAKEFIREQFNILTDRIFNEKRKFIQVLVGPRQVGKTTIIKQMLKKTTIFTADYSVDNIVAADGVWLDNVWERLRLEMKSQGKTEGLLVVDEIQRIPNWGLAVKRNWDEDTKNDVNIKLVLSGSSRLMLQKGLTESLMGRFELIRAGHWSYAEMKKAFGYTPEEFVWFGGYPGGAGFINDEERFKLYIKDAVVESGINRDILMLTPIDKPALLRQLFDIGVVYSGQILSYNKILGQLQDAGNTVTLAKYLRLLEQSGLLAGLEMHSEKLIKIKSSSPKFQVYNTALISAGQTEIFEDALDNKTWWGRLVESAVGAHLLNEVNKNPNAKLLYWRETSGGVKYEVDFVIKYGSKIVGIEVKSGADDINMNAIRRFKDKFAGAEVVLIGDKWIKWQTAITMRLKDIVEQNIP
ncbi:MAG: AAA family ATPase [Elusimicrobiota bacterium]|jgi:predicted AAA+ superfamily ATPase|nr:AAA family ATPase [Elusimicrobiota bacterium]